MFDKMKQAVQRVHLEAAAVDRDVEAAKADIRRGARSTDHRFELGTGAERWGNRIAGYEVKPGEQRPERNIASISEPPEAWYGLRCRTGRETEAQEAVEALGLEVIIPTYRTRTWPRKKRASVQIERPLCPGYLFAFMSPRRWADVAACDRVLGWISTLGRPCPVGRPDELRRFQNEALSGMHDDKTGVDVRFQDGELLEILFGPFAGWQVSFKALRGNRIEGEVDMLGAPRRVLISPQDLNARKG